MKKNVLTMIFFFSGITIFAHELLIPYSLNNKIGFVDENLHILSEPQYEGEVSDNTKKMILLDCPKFDVLVDDNGQLLTRGIDYIYIIGDNEYAVSQRDGDGYGRIFSLDRKVLHYYDRIMITKADHYGNLIIQDKHKNAISRLNIINSNGDFLYLNNSYKRIFGYYNEKKIAFVQDDDFNDCLVDANGKKINTVPFQFGMRSMNEGYVFGKNLQTGECGFYNMDCKCVIKAYTKDGSNMDDWNCYPGISCGVVALVNDGEKNVFLSEWQTLHSDYWSIVDTNGKFIEFGITADKIYPFSDDVAVLMLQDGKKNIYRLINKNGKIITDRDFDQINSSVNGYCMAEKDGVDYLIKSKDGSVYRCSDFK